MWHQGVISQSETRLQSLDLQRRSEYTYWEDGTNWLMFKVTVVCYVFDTCH